jgi:LuxR family maltose regulon positive regulatory protein
MRSISTETGWLEQDSATPVLCLLEVSNGRFDEAAEMAALMAERSKACGRIPAEIRAHLLTALIASTAGEPGNVRLALRRAVDLAAPQSIIQPFFEHNNQLLQLLRDFQRLERDALPAQQNNFLSGLILRIIATGKAKGSSERLTAREREILAHLVQGGSNKVIARALDLTENAVKFHLKNVFRKLGVENRAVAAAVAERMEPIHW